MSTTATHNRRTKPATDPLAPARALIERIEAARLAGNGVDAFAAGDARALLQRAPESKERAALLLRLDAAVAPAPRPTPEPIAPEEPKATKPRPRARGHRSDAPRRRAPGDRALVPLPLPPETPPDDEDDNEPATETGPKGKPGFASAGPPNGYRTWDTLRARVADFVDPVPAGRGGEPEDEEDARALIAFLERSIGRLRSWLKHRHPVEGFDELIAFPSEKDPATFTAFSDADYYTADPEGVGMANDGADDFDRPLSAELAAQRIEAERARVNAERTTEAKS